MGPLEELNIEEALFAAYLAGRDDAEGQSWRNGENVKRANEQRRSDALEAIAKAEVDALRTLGQIGSTFATIAESIAKSMQSRRNQL